MDNLEEKLKVIWRHLVAMPAALEDFERRSGVTFIDDPTRFNLLPELDLEYIDRKYEDAKSASESAINP